MLLKELLLFLRAGGEEGRTDLETALLYFSFSLHNSSNEGIQKICDGGKTNGRESA